ncbi:MAG: hypothetical protein ACTSRY_00505 [Alphaproteobacteria bacterium]
MAILGLGAALLFVPLGAEAHDPGVGEGGFAHLFAGPDHFFDLIAGVLALVGVLLLGAAARALRRSGAAFSR